MKETGEQIDQETLNQLIRLRGLQDPEFFTNYFLGDKLEFPFSKMHYDFFKAASDPYKRGVREAIAAPRGHAKTFLKLHAKILHAICYQTETFILVLGNSMPDAEDKVAQIREVLETNHRIKAVFGNLSQTHRNSQYSSRKKFVTANNIMVMARSKGQSIRGLNHNGNRPSLIILDDVESMKEVRNPLQRNKTREWFFKDILKLGKLQGQTNITVIGTCLHPESLLMELLRNPGWTSSCYRAVISFSSRQDLWSKYREILINLSNANRLKDALAFYYANETAMLVGSEVLWPEGEPYEILMRIRIEEGEAAFNSEKQNEPHDPETQMFDMEGAQSFKLRYENDEVVGLETLQTRKFISPKQIKRLIAYHDPAMGQAPTKQGDPDYACIVVAAQDINDYIYVLDVYLEKDLPDQQVIRMLQLYEKWRFETLYFEDNGSQALMKQIYRDALARLPEKLDLKIQGVHQTEEKVSRISTLQPEILNGWILFSDDLSDRFLDQMTYFPTSSHDDGPDALHGAVRQLKRRLGTITMVRQGYVPG